MKDDGNQLLELAVRAGLIAEKQANFLREELSMFPGQNVRQMMIKRGLVSAEAIQTLEQAAEDPAELERIMSASAPAAPAPSPAPRPSVVQAAPPGPTAVPGSPVGSAPQTAQSKLAAQQAAYQASRGMPPAPVPSAMPQPIQAPSPMAAPPPPAAATAEPAPPPPPPQRAPVVELCAQHSNATLNDYLKMAREAGCSDVHLVAGRSPFVRRLGLLYFLDEPPLTPERSEEINLSALSETQQDQLRQMQQLDFAMDIPGLGRHRCNIFKQRLGWDGIYRIIPQTVPTLEELGMPPVLQKLTQYHQGLVLVTGPSGCGKSTTVAAMLDYINRNRTDHIITVEDPVEYVLKPIGCQITQREVGNHTQSFGNALRGALRQDPDIIMVGEMRDLETTSIAISAAETGHLVFGTLHTNSAVRTVARVMDVYPPSQRAQICTMVSESIRGILSQQLIQRKDGEGQVVAMEILIFTTGVAQLIKEGKTHQLVSLMQSGKRIGMRIMDDVLMELYQQNLISGREAYQRAENKPAFESMKAQD